MDITTDVRINMMDDIHLARKELYSSGHRGEGAEGDGEKPAFSCQSSILAPVGSAAPRLVRKCDYTGWKALCKYKQVLMLLDAHIGAHLHSLNMLPFFCHHQNNEIKNVLQLRMAMRLRQMWNDADNARIFANIYASICGEFWCRAIHNHSPSVCHCQCPLVIGIITSINITCFLTLCSVHLAIILGKGFSILQDRNSSS